MQGLSEMNVLRWLQTYLIIVAVLVVVGDLHAAEAKRRRGPEAKFQPYDMEATVLSVRRSEFGTFAEVIRENGSYEWVEIDRDDDTQVRTGQRVAYTVSAISRRNNLVDWYRPVTNFRVVLPEEKVYRRKADDGTLIFSDNPVQPMKTP
jgi:hypothetical protein